MNPIILYNVYNTETFNYYVIKKTSYESTFLSIKIFIKIPLQKDL